MSTTVRLPARHQHKFERLSDAAIYCACGEIRLAAAPPCPYQHYHPTWIYQPPVIWPPYTVWSTNQTISTTSEANIGSTYVSDGTEMVTYTS